MPFRGRHISVWEHATDEGRWDIDIVNPQNASISLHVCTYCMFCRYYAMPIVELLPETARTFHNLIVGRYVMDFSILMWTEDARSAVLRHLAAEGTCNIGMSGQQSVRQTIAPKIKFLKKGKSSP